MSAAKDPGSDNAEEGSLEAGAPRHGALDHLMSLPSAERRATLRKLATQPRDAGAGGLPATTSRRFAERWATNVFSPVHELTEPTGTWRTMAYLLLTGAASPFLLSIPWAFAQVGWVVGIAFLLVCIASATFTSTLFAELADDGGERHNTVGDVADAVYGELVLHLGAGGWQPRTCGSCSRRPGRLTGSGHVLHAAAPVQATAGATPAWPSHPSC